MKRVLSVVVVLAMMATLFAVPASAATPVIPSAQDMYASAYTAGAVMPVNLDAYSPPNHAFRLNPANALGAFDAVQGDTSLNERFFALNGRTWTNYTFAESFCNVDWDDDIEFAEVTWSSWHTEAALVYLTGAVVNGAPYGTVDDGIGYYAGIVWNKIGIKGLTEAAREAKAQEYAVAMGVTRVFISNRFEQNGNFGMSLFNLPDEVVCAKGITLVDITDDVYGMVDGLIGPYAYPSDGPLYGQPGTYLSNPGVGATITVTGLDPFAYTAVPGAEGNTDGYDLDAILVHKGARHKEGDSATGMGSIIKKKGTWFMYNKYTASDLATATFDIQAGNPKNGTWFIGTCTVTNNGGNMYVVNYTMDPTITLNGWMYDIVVTDEHLGISDTMNFRGVPGQDDNQDFGVPFTDADGVFFIFAHFGVEYN